MDKTFPGWNTNPGVAQATSFYTPQWLKHGIYSQYCPPDCPLLSKKEDKLFQVNFDHLLTQKKEFNLLEEWQKIPKWDNGNTIFDRTTTPSFKSMVKKDVFEKMEENVKKYKESKYP